MKLIAISGSILVMLFSQCVLAASPLGIWKTIDDVTGDPKSLVEIKEGRGHSLSGTVIKLFNNPDKRCEACAGKEQNQPIVGMTVMTQLKQSADSQNEWVGGEILDPKNGKRYHCTITLLDQGAQLKVRGYIGLPLFGRSQTWSRVENQQNQ